MMFYIQDVRKALEKWAFLSMRMRRNSLRDQTLYSALIPLLLCASCAADPKSSEDACISNTLQAVEDEKREDYPSAERHYLQALEQSQHSDNALQLPKVLQGLAQVYAQEKKFDQAKESLRRALDRYTSIEKKVD